MRTTTTTLTELAALDSASHLPLGGMYAASAVAATAREFGSRGLDILEDGGRLVVFATRDLGATARATFGEFLNRALELTLGRPN